MLEGLIQDHLHVITESLLWIKATMAGITVILLLLQAH